jgi:Cu/Ag efflux protein CusF
MKKLIALPSVMIFSLFSVQCSEKEQTSENTDGVTPGAEMSEVDVVESGTYTGTADKVDTEEMEIYVKLDDGKMIELYLKESTPMMKGTEKVTFDALKEGQKLEVEVEKSGEHLNPVSVKIME